ncbi:uncharacterized protein LOC120454009 isoform X1 [Drosophila santomea]|nr:uncharacterized protein LOC120454009 isoform X1 [Drosophila santomea]
MTGHLWTLRHLPVEAIFDADGKQMDFIPNIRVIRSQRKTIKLMFKKYAYSKSNNHEATTYWHCRSRRNGNPACKARFSTKKLRNGRYKVYLTQPEHNHPPKKRHL